MTVVLQNGICSTFVSSFHLGIDCVDDTLACCGCACYYFQITVWFGSRQYRFISCCTGSRTSCHGRLSCSQSPCLRILSLHSQSFSRSPLMRRQFSFEHCNMRQGLSTSTCQVHLQFTHGLREKWNANKFAVWSQNGTNDPCLHLRSTYVLHGQSRDIFTLFPMPYS